MNGERFDGWTRGLLTPISRRGLGGVAIVFAALGVTGADAKKKKKGKKKKKKPQQKPVSFACATPGATCGRTGACGCVRDSNESQICVSFVPPGGVITDCETNDDCTGGTVCVGGGDNLFCATPARIDGVIGATSPPHRQGNESSRPPAHVARAGKTCGKADQPGRA